MSQGQVSYSSVQDFFRKTNEFFLLAGIFLIVFSVVCVLLEVQTSEAAIRHSGGINVLIEPSMATFGQFIDLVQERLSPFETIVVLWGWGSQILYFACVVGFNEFHKSIAKHNGILAMICCGGAVGIAIYNCVTDFNYVSLVIHDFAWQLAITGVIAILAAVGGIAGIHFIKVGLGRA